MFSKFSVLPSVSKYLRGSKRFLHISQKFKGHNGKCSFDYSQRACNSCGLNTSRPQCSSCSSQSPGPNIHIVRQMSSKDSKGDTHKTLDHGGIVQNNKEPKIDVTVGRRVFRRNKTRRESRESFRRGDRFKFSSRRRRGNRDVTTVPVLDTPNKDLGLALSQEAAVVKSSAESKGDNLTSNGGISKSMLPPKNLHVEYIESINLKDIELEKKPSTPINSSSNDNLKPNLNSVKDIRNIEIKPKAIPLEAMHLPKPKQEANRNDPMKIVKENKTTNNPSNQVTVEPKYLGSVNLATSSPSGSQTISNSSGYSNLNVSTPPQTPKTPPVIVKTFKTNFKTISPNSDHKLDTAEKLNNSSTKDTKFSKLIERVTSWNLESAEVNTQSTSTNHETKVDVLKVPSTPTLSGGQSTKTDKLNEPIAQQIQPIMGSNILHSLDRSQDVLAKDFKAGNNKTPQVKRSKIDFRNNEIKLDTTTRTPNNSGNQNTRAKLDMKMVNLNPSKSEDNTSSKTKNQLDFIPPPTYTNVQEKIVQTNNEINLKDSKPTLKEPFPRTIISQPPLKSMKSGVFNFKNNHTSDDNEQYKLRPKVISKYKRGEMFKKATEKILGRIEKAKPKTSPKGADEKPIIEKDLPTNKPIENSPKSPKTKFEPIPLQLVENVQTQKMDLPTNEPLENIATKSDTPTIVLIPLQSVKNVQKQQMDMPSNEPIGNLPKSDKTKIVPIPLQSLKTAQKKQKEMPSNEPIGNLPKFSKPKIVPNTIQDVTNYQKKLMDTATDEPIENLQNAASPKIVPIPIQSGKNAPIQQMDAPKTDIKSNTSTSGSNKLLPKLDTDILYVKKVPKTCENDQKVEPGNVKIVEKLPPTTMDSANLSQKVPPTHFQNKIKQSLDKSKEDNKTKSLVKQDKTSLNTKPMKTIKLKKDTLDAFINAPLKHSVNSNSKSLNEPTTAKSTNTANVKASKSHDQIAFNTSNITTKSAVNDLENSPSTSNLNKKAPSKTSEKVLKHSTSSFLDNYGISQMPKDYPRNMFGEPISPERLKKSQEKLIAFQKNLEYTAARHSSNQGGSKISKDDNVIRTKSSTRPGALRRPVTRGGGGEGGSRGSDNNDDGNRPIYDTEGRVINFWRTLTISSVYIAFSFMVYMMDGIQPLNPWQQLFNAMTKEQTEAIIRLQPATYGNDVTNLQQVDNNNEETENRQQTEMIGLEMKDNDFGGEHGGEDGGSVKEKTKFEKV